MFFAPMGRFQLELIYLYFPPSFHQITTNNNKQQLFDGRTVENKGKLILTTMDVYKSIKYRQSRSSLLSDSVTNRLY